MTPELQKYCHRWSQRMDRISSEDERMSFFQEQLPELLLDHATVRPVLQNMALGRPWPDLRDPGMFANEVLLYLDPGRRFSLRVYFHLPGEYTVIHDHTAWGVSGTPFGRLSVIGYSRDHTGQSAQDQLKRTRRTVHAPGQVELTLPGDPGIHQTGSPDDAINVMISVYGRPGRRLYIQTYDRRTGQIAKLYPPKILRRMLARQALEAM